MPNRFNNLRTSEIKDIKRKEAAERQAKRDKRTIAEQLEHLRNRPGSSLKETAKLVKKLAAKEGQGIRAEIVEAVTDTFGKEAGKVTENLIAPKERG